MEQIDSFVWKLNFCLTTKHLYENKRQTHIGKIFCNTYKS